MVLVRATPFRSVLLRIAAARVEYAWNGFRRSPDVVGGSGRSFNFVPRLTVVKCSVSIYDCLRQSQAVLG